MPTQTEHGVFISDAEKNAAIRKGEADLRAWRLRNPDAPTGRPIPTPADPKTEATP